MGTLEKPSYISNDCFVRLKPDIPWGYQMQHITMRLLIHELASITDVNLDEEAIYHKLLRCVLQAKKIDEAIQMPETKADYDPDTDPDQGKFDF